MKTIFQAQTLNPYRSKNPKGFYNILRGHSGTDLGYTHEDLPSPITGQVVGKVVQHEMGNCLYIKDIKGNIHVFAHLSEFKVSMGMTITRGIVIAKTGNTGSKTTNPHLHYEIITQKPINLIDRIMSRNLMGFKGFNTDAILYLKNLYAEYNVTIK